MTIPAKGSRRVCVDDAEYSWRIRKKPTYDQGVYQTPMRLAIQLCTDGPKQVLVVNLQVSRPDNWIAPHQTSVTPAVVRDIVRRALKKGWIPNGGGSAFQIDYRLITNRA